MRNEFDLFSSHSLAANFDARSEGYDKIGTQAKAVVIRMTLHDFTENRMGWPFEHHENLSCGYGQALSSANTEGHARPAPVINVKPQGRESLDLRMLGYAGLVPVPFELAAHKRVFIERPDRPQYADFLIPDANRVIRSGRI